MYATAQNSNSNYFIVQMFKNLQQLLLLKPDIWVEMKKICFRPSNNQRNIEPCYLLILYYKTFHQIMCVSNLTNFSLVRIMFQPRQKSMILGLGMESLIQNHSTRWRLN